MKTASHYTFSGPGRICISLGAPRGAPGGYRIFKKLAPTREILKIHDQEEYRRRFRAEVLGPLDPKATWDELHRLANGAEPVLQCFERPPFTADNWCHRRMVADWFAETLGVMVDELEPESMDQRRRHADDRARAKMAPGLSDERRSLLIVRPLVNAIRSEIDTFWKLVCRRLGAERTWTWMGLPDRIRERMTTTELGEWDALQERYRWVDASK